LGTGGERRPHSGSTVIEPEPDGRPEQTGRTGRRGGPLFETRIERTESLTYVELLGEFDLSCVNRYAEAVAVVRGGKLVIDLRGLTFIDSTGLRMFIETWQRSRDEGFVLEIVGAHDQVAKVFRITCIESALPVTESSSLNGQDDVDDHR
jgi:anti-sigma B factor antagonist